MLAIRGRLLELTIDQDLQKGEASGCTRAARPSCAERQSPSPDGPTKRFSKGVGWKTTFCAVLPIAATVFLSSPAVAGCARWEQPTRVGYLLIVNDCDQKITVHVLSGGGPQGGRADRYFHLGSKEVRQIRALALGDASIESEVDGWDRANADPGLQYLETRIDRLGDTDVCTARNTHPNRFLAARIDAEGAYSEPVIKPLSELRTWPYFPRRSNEPCKATSAILDPE